MGNSVTTILHNNYSEKPLTPKSSNQKPTFKYELDLSSHESLKVSICMMISLTGHED